MIFDTRSVLTNNTLTVASTDSTIGVNSLLLQDTDTIIKLQSLEELMSSAPYEEPVAVFGADICEATVGNSVARLPWYMEYGHIVFWFYLLGTIIISMWLVYSFSLLSSSKETSNPVRETRGFSRAQTGDTLTAIIPLCWSITMLMHASVHTNNFDENTDSTSLTITVMAYQWGWNYYFPEDTVRRLQQTTSEVPYGEALKTQPTLLNLTTPIAITSKSQIISEPHASSITPFLASLVNLTLPAHLTIQPWCTLVFGNSRSMAASDVTSALPRLTPDMLLTHLVANEKSNLWKIATPAYKARIARLLNLVNNLRSYEIELQVPVLAIRGGFDLELIALRSGTLVQGDQTGNFNLAYNKLTKNLNKPNPLAGAKLDIRNVLFPFSSESSIFETAASLAAQGAWNTYIVCFFRNVMPSGTSIQVGVEFLEDLVSIVNPTRRTVLQHCTRVGHNSRIILPRTGEDLDAKFWTPTTDVAISSTRQPSPLAHSTSFATGLVHRMRINTGVVMPSDTPIEIICGSKDVVHSWAIPGLGIKIDCIPGYNCHRRLLIRWRGLFWGQCMEVCGRYHHWMPILIKVDHVDIFILWLKTISSN